MAKNRYATYTVFRTERDFIEGVEGKALTWLDRTKEGSSKHSAFALIQKRKLAEIAPELERTEDPEERWRIVKGAMSKAGKEYREIAKDPAKLEATARAAVEEMCKEVGWIADVVKGITSKIDEVERAVREAVRV